MSKRAGSRRCPECGSALASDEPKARCIWCGKMHAWGEPHKDCWKVTSSRCNHGKCVIGCGRKYHKVGACGDEYCFMKYCKKCCARPQKWKYRAFRKSVA